MTFEIKCWSCGKGIMVDGPQPQLATDLLEAANAAGMLGVIDWRYKRTLVFCDDACLKKQLTADGKSIRLRPKK